MAIVDKSLASTYDANMVYNIDDVVSYGNKIYQCIANNTTGEFNLENWERTYLADIFDTASSATLESSLAAQYNNESTYEVGNYVVYENSLYKCITEVSEAEEFDSEKWERYYLSSFIKDDTSGTGSGSANVRLLVSASSSSTDMTISLYAEDECIYTKTATYHAQSVDNTYTIDKNNKTSIQEYSEQITLSSKVYTTFDLAIPYEKLNGLCILAEGRQTAVLFSKQISETTYQGYQGKRYNLDSFDVGTVYKFNISDTQFQFYTATAGSYTVYYF